MRILKTIIAVTALLLIGLTAFLIIYGRSDFTVEKNNSSYISVIEQMNGTDRHTMELNAGDALQIKYRTEKGFLHMELTAPSGATIYDGNGKGVTDFSLRLTETGKYTVTVTARNAKGTVNIQLKEKSK